MKAGEPLVLDSCTVIAHFKSDAKAKQLIESAEELYLPLAAYGELYYGALKSEKRQYRLAELKTFLEIVTLAYPTQHIAQTYGELKLQLSLKGLPIPENDLWIAATASLYNLHLVTKDNHFTRIDGLQVITL